MYYSKRISNSSNKTKCTWKIINELIGKHHSSNDIHELKVDDKHYTNQSDIVDLLNQHFSTVVDKLIGNTEKNGSFNNSPIYLLNNVIHKSSLIDI